MALLRSTAARALVVLALVAALGAYGLIRAPDFLTSPGQAAVRADAAFVLGGSAGDRELQAAEIFRQGLVRTFVMTGMEDVIPEAELLEMHWRAHLLKRAGIPAESILLDAFSTNSDDEAAIGLKLARERGWKRVLVLSDPPHMRRLSVIWGRAFAGSGIELHFVPSRPKWWAPERWWTSRRSAQFLVSEYIKLVYTIL